jgi:two-component system copper resistance phosphate regulon response regulator CusR
MRLLIIEDDEKTANALASGLQQGGFSTSTAHTGEEGFFLLNAETFDLVVLDWMLPGRSGIEILKTLRSRGNKTPVLLLTARDAVDDRVLGLESGADDYLVKPFAFAELVARIRTLLRRSGPSEPLRKTVADLIVDLESRRATRANKAIELTPREFDLLAFLLKQPGQVVTREMLAKEVWREANRITPLDNVIDVHVAHLTRKVDEGHGAHQNNLRFGNARSAWHSSPVSRSNLPKPFIWSASCIFGLLAEFTHTLSLRAPFLLS